MFVLGWVWMLFWLVKQPLLLLVTSSSTIQKARTNHLSILKAVRATNWCLCKDYLRKTGPGLEVVRWGQRCIGTSKFIQRTYDCHHKGVLWRIMIASVCLSSAVDPSHIFNLNVTTPVLNHLITRKPERNFHSNCTTLNNSQISLWLINILNFWIWR